MSRLNSCLAGLRVLDFSPFLPGPLASLFLADLGAEILKVEPPSGDSMRLFGPRDASGAPVFHGAVNAGKSICRLDLKSEAGHAAAFALAAGADVLLEGFRPGVMKRLGLDYSSLKALNPRLVYCSMSGFGAEGPLAHVAGHDANFLALAGVLFRNGRVPVYYDPPIADSCGSLFAAISILAALHARARDGRGCHLDLALADSVMPVQLFQVAAYGASAANPASGDTYLNCGAACYQVYRTRDGRHIALGALETKFWRNFCDAAARSDWAERQWEPMPQHDLIASVSALVGELTLDECMVRFGEADCCCSPVLDLGEALGSPHHQRRGLIRRSAEGDLQTLLPVIVDGAPPRTRARVRELSGGANWGPEKAAGGEEP